MATTAPRREPEQCREPLRWCDLVVGLVAIGVLAAGIDGGPIRLCCEAVRADDFDGNGPDSPPATNLKGDDPRPGEFKDDSQLGTSAGMGEPGSVESATGQALGVEIEADSGGAFLAPGRINDREVVFVVDTGADRIAISERLKDRLKLRRGKYLQRIVDGSVVGGYETHIERLELGPLRFEGVTGWLNPRVAEDVVRLGVSALNGVRFERGNGKLTLIPLHSAAMERRAGTGRDGVPTLRRSLDECRASGRIIDRIVLDCLEGR